MSFIARRLVVIIGFLTLRCGGNELTKQFISSWDFSNEVNWQDGNLPCSGRGVEFRRKPEFPVFVGSDLSMKSIDFLNDVTLIFGRNSSISFDLGRDTSCKGTNEGKGVNFEYTATDFKKILGLHFKLFPFGAEHCVNTMNNGGPNDVWQPPILPFNDAIFENKGVDYWWEPDSWKCVNKNAFGCNSAVPDIHRVPCQSDSVLVSDPDDSLYRIIFTDPIPTVKSLQLGHKKHTTTSFYDFAISDEGRQRIIKRYSTNIEAPLYIEYEGSCRDVTGCSCHPSTPVGEICKHIKRKCPQTSCTSPIYMQGFCCKMCGVDISINHNGSLAISSVRKILDVVLNSPQGSNVNGYLGKMPDDRIHVYFIPQNDWVDYNDASFLFTQLFGRDLNVNGKYAVKSEFATGILLPKKKISGALAVTVSLFFIILGVAFAVYLYRKRRVKDLPFMFRRMSYVSTRSMRSSSIPISPSTLQDSDARPGSYTFTNPTFGKSEDTSSASSTQTPFNTTSESEHPTQRENPLFKVQMDLGTSSSAPQDRGTSFSAPQDLGISFSALRDDPIEEEIAKATQVESVGEEPTTDPLICIVDLEDGGPGSGAPGEVENDRLQEDEDPLDLLAKSRVTKDKGSDVSDHKNEDITEVSTAQNNTNQIVLEREQTLLNPPMLLCEPGDGPQDDPSEEVVNTTLESKGDLDLTFLDF